MDSLFPQNDLEARARFLAASSAPQALANGDGRESWTFEVPSKTESGLKMDILYYPARENPQRLLILSSGVHGMEASTGSAIQEMFFKEFFPSVDRRYLSLFVIHSMNPYGFRKSRRSTENNVNLNRNFAAHPEHFKTPNEGYKKLASQLKPQRAVSRFALTPLSAALFVARARLNGFTGAALNQSLAQGQFEFPDGLEYGGAGPEPQIAFLQDKLRAVFARARDLVLFDLHTGLGVQGELHLLAGDHPRCVDPVLFAEVMGPERRAGVYAYTSQEAPGFYRTIGDFNSWVAASATPEQRVLALTLEYGTLGNSLPAKLQMLKRITNENQGYHCGYANDEVRARVAREFAELFSPTSASWQLNALERARRVFEHALPALARPC